MWKGALVFKNLVSYICEVGSELSLERPRSTECSQISENVVNASTKNKMSRRTNCLQIGFYFQLKLSGINAFCIS